MNTKNTRDEVLIGIVTLNRKEKLIKTLYECRRLGFPNIVVVDNGSTDGTRAYLERQDNVARIFTDSNIGGSGGFNEVMRYFLERTSCNWLLTFDDDAYPAFRCDALQACISREEGCQYPAYAFKVTYPDGALCEMNKPGVNVLSKNPLLQLGRDFHIDESSGECLVDFAGFVGLLLARETVKTVGVVSKEFFIYSDDTYYTLSISSKLGKICYCPDLTLIHDCKRSSRRFVHHDAMRLQRDIVNKIVMIREYSRFRTAYVALYIVRCIYMNPALSMKILQAFVKGISANIALYRNEVVA